MWQATRSPILCWRVTVATSGLALVLAQLLAPFSQPLPFLVFLAAVAISAWYGGLWPGLLATAIALAGSGYLLLGPRAMAPDGSSVALGLGTLLLVALLISILMARLHATGEATPSRCSAEALSGPGCNDARAGERPTAASNRASYRRLGVTGGETPSYVGTVGRPRAAPEDDALVALARMTLPRLGDWCAIDVVEGDQTAHRLMAVHTDTIDTDIERELRRRLPSAPVGLACPLRVTRNGDEAGGPPDARAYEQATRVVLTELGLASAIALPMKLDGRVLGSMILISADADRCATAERRLLAAEMAARGGLLLENQRLRHDLDGTCAYLDGILAGMRDALLVIGADGRYIEANTVAAALFGRARDELTQLRVGDLPILGPSWTEPETARFVREGRWEGRMDVQRRDGSLVTVDVQATAIVLHHDTIYMTTLREVGGRGASCPRAFSPGGEQSKLGGTERSEPCRTEETMRKPIPACGPPSARHAGGDTGGGS